MAFVFRLQTLWLKHFSKIYQLKCLSPKNKRPLELLWMLWFDEKNYSVLKYALSFILNNGERERAPIKKYTLSDSSFHKMMFLSYHAYSRERKKWVACWQNWAEKMDENGTILAKFISWWDVIRTETFSFAS